MTEFDDERYLVADFLYVVYLIAGRDPELCAIPREAIDPKFVSPKRGYRISSRFKKESILKPYLHAI